MTRLILALALLAAPIVAPGAALAQEPTCGREEATMSCAEGTIWDTRARACVPVVG